MDKKHSKFFIAIIAISICNLILMIALSLFVFLSVSGTEISNTVKSITSNSGISKNISDLPATFDILVEAWQLLNGEYVDKYDLDPEQLSRGAVRGMIQALGDPHSAYVNPELHKLEMSSIRGKYQGIGAYVGMKDELLTIVAPIEGSPAEKAGLKAGDRIIEIDGISSAGMSLAEAALTIQGPEGTVVVLTIVREGLEEPMKIEITRGEITIKSVYWEKKNNYAYIRLTSFMQTTSYDFEATLKYIADEKVDGIILDLRNNPGGLLSVSVDVASQFISDGIIVDVVDSDGHHSPIKARPGGLALDSPLIVLVNDGSASGSEVLAGALQDYGRAKLAGKKTYGKGSVQIIRNLEDGSAIHLTIARWYTPLGRPIDGSGLTPDYELDLEDDDLIKWAIDYLNGEEVAAYPQELINN